MTNSGVAEHDIVGGFVLAYLEIITKPSLNL